MSLLNNIVNMLNEAYQYINWAYFYKYQINLYQSITIYINVQYLYYSIIVKICKINRIFFNKGKSSKDQLM